MKNLPRRRIACGFALLVLLIAVADDCDAADSTPFRRWAVVGDSTTRESGISDLVTSEMAQWEKVELVEREELQRVTQELELSQLHSAAQSA